MDGSTDSVISQFSRNQTQMEVSMQCVHWERVLGSIPGEDKQRGGMPAAEQAQQQVEGGKPYRTELRDWLLYPLM